MPNNTLEYILRLRDEFSRSLQAAGAGAMSAMGGVTSQSKALEDGLQSVFTRTGQGFALLTGHYEGLGGILGAIPGPIGVVAEQLGNFVGGAITQVLQLADSYDKLSQRTGFSVEFLSQFTEAADDVRISAGTVEAGVMKFSRALGGLGDASDEAMNGAKGVGGAFEGLGIKTRDTEGKIRPLEDLLLDVSDSFQRMPDGPEKAALAVQLFGRSGAELIPILNKGSQAIKDMMQSAKDTGLTFDRDTIAAMARLKTAQDTLEDSWTGLTRKVGTAVIPALADFTQAMNMGMEKTQKVRESQGELAGFMSTFESSWNFLTGQVKLNTEAAQTNETATRDNKEEKADAAEAAARLKDEEAKLNDQIRNVTGAFGGQTEAMTDMELAQTVIKLATGEITQAQFDQREAAEALTKAYRDGEIDFEDVTTTMVELAKGTIDVDEAMKRAGKAGEKYSGEMKGVDYQLARVTSSTNTYKGAVNTIPTGKTTTISAAVTDATDAIDRHVAKLGTIPTTTTTTMGAAAHPQASTTVDNFKNKVNEVPSGRTTSLYVDYPPSQATTVDNFKNKINEIPSQKTTSAWVSTNGIYGTGGVQDAIDHINSLRGMNTNVAVSSYVNVTYVGDVPPPPMKPQGKPQGRAQGGGGDGGSFVNMPMNVNVRTMAGAKALQDALRATARAASLRASMG